MTQIHVVIRRINPALKVDFVQIGYIKDGQFASLPLDTFDHTPIVDYVNHSTISDSPYIDHSVVSALIEALIAYPDFSVEFFDNTLVLMFDFNLNADEITKEEKGKGN